MSEAGEATLMEAAASVSPQAARKDLLDLGGGDCPGVLVISNLSGDVISPARLSRQQALRERSSPRGCLATSRGSM